MDGIGNLYAPGIQLVWIFTKLPGSVFKNRTATGENKCGGNRYGKDPYSGSVVKTKN